MIAKPGSSTGRSANAPCPLAEMPPFRVLPAQLRDKLSAISRRRNLERNATLIDIGESANLVGCVLKGVLRMSKTLVDGQQQIVGLLVAGDIFGRVFDGDFPFSIEAATDCEICLFPKAEFEALMEHWPELEKLVILGLLNELDSAREWLGLVANHRTVEKVAGFLVFLHRRWAFLAEEEERPDGTLIDLPIKRQDLAHFLGTRPEAISRAIHALHDEGHIRIVTPYRLLIVDFDALDRISGQSVSQLDVHRALASGEGPR